MADGKGGHQPLTQGRHISVILAEEEKVERREWRWQPSGGWETDHQPLMQGRHISVIQAEEEQVGRMEWKWQPSGRWERWPPASYSR